MRPPDYERGGIRLWCGDCLDLLSEVESVDHIITDPPYARDVYTRLRGPNTHKGSATPQRMGIKNHQYSSCGIERLAAGDIGAVDEMFGPCSVEFGRICKRWAIVFSDAESIHRWREAMLDAGMRYVRTGAWVKPDAMPQFSGDRPAVGFEPCTIMHAQGPMEWNGGGHKAVWTHNTVKGNSAGRTAHPCPKPVPLMIELVKLFSDPDETILDPFLGSGTTAVACVKTGRRCMGIEISREYFDIAVTRVEAAFEETALLDYAEAGE